MRSSVAVLSALAAGAVASGVKYETVTETIISCPAEFTNCPSTTSAPAGSPTDDVLSGHETPAPAAYHDESAPGDESVTPVEGVPVDGVPAGSHEEGSDSAIPVDATPGTPGPHEADSESATPVDQVPADATPGSEAGTPGPHEEGSESMMSSEEGGVPTDAEEHVPAATDSMEHVPDAAATPTDMAPEHVSASLTMVSSGVAPISTGSMGEHLNNGTNNGTDSITPFTGAASLVSSSFGALAGFAAIAAFFLA